MGGRLSRRLSGWEAYDGPRGPACWGPTDTYLEVVQSMLIPFTGVCLTFNFPQAAVWFYVDIYGYRH